MRRCGSGAPPSTSCQEAGTGPSLTGWRSELPEQLAQVKEALSCPPLHPLGHEAWIKGSKLGFCQGLAGLGWVGGLVGKETVEVQRLLEEL